MDLKGKVVVVNGGASGTGEQVVRTLVEEGVKNIEFELSGRVFAVTGGASGIGAAFVRLLVQENAKHVAVLDVNEELGSRLQRELNAEKSGIVKFHKCDVTKDEELFEALGNITDEHSYIDVLVNNAGILHETMNSYKKCIDLNMTASITSTFKYMETNRKDHGGRGGTVLNVASLAAFLHLPQVPVYGSTKSAVLHFSTSIGAEENYKRTGIRVISICFGLTNSSFINNLRCYDEEMDKSYADFLSAHAHNFQSAESAARAMAEAVRRGDSGSVWTSCDDKPAKDITAVYKKAYATVTAEIP